MKAKRFEQLLSQQTVVAQKVFNAVSATEGWPSKRIYLELQNSGTPVRDMRMVEGCLASLVKSKLLLEKPTGMFKQMVPSDAAPGKEEVALDQPTPTEPKKEKYKPDAAQIEAWSQSRHDPEPVEPEVSPTPPAIEPIKAAEPVVPLVLPKLPPIPGHEKTDALAQVAVDVPEGHFSQYLLPQHDILVNYPNSGGTQNYTILLAAQPGDVVRFARPEGLSLSAWRGRIQATRWNYYNKHGILLEAHFFQTYVDLLVMRLDTVAPPVNTLNVSNRAISEQEERAFPSRALGSTVVRTSEAPDAPHTLGSVVDAEKLKRAVADNVPLHTASEGDASSEAEAPVGIAGPDGYMHSAVPLTEGEPEPVDREGPPVGALGGLPWALPSGPVRLAHPWDDRLPEPAPVPSVVPSENKDKDDALTSSEVEREFWQKVFFMELERSANVEQAISNANKAIAAHRRHFYD